ncbi:MAG: hypothetical protein DRQ40_06315 [Gammaproteobacteria bacterium]|nr:MAG: hypothetical protein DRQ40_06315 [Gammaproteobacteria bacterium]
MIVELENFTCSITPAKYTDANGISTDENLVRITYSTGNELWDKLKYSNQQMTIVKYGRDDISCPRTNIPEWVEYVIHNMSKEDLDIAYYHYVDNYLTFVK